ncbi:TIGR01244 family sulfur transferase [Reinekea sp.]|jgi:sulfide:quinone oxidoreductase|uniref:TIGR01244 family sulfur transferase n=1 Tax=Reinekea sp. TaxID=1970455 RepID=UPI003989355C
MDSRTINETLSISGQIQVNDLTPLAQAGITTIIVNRPDGEGSDQVNFEEIHMAAEAVGIQAKYLPVTPGKATDAQAVQFGEILKASKGQVHAYCRTGMRSSTLWALHRKSEGDDVVSILSTLTHAGFDASGLTDRLTNTTDAQQVIPSYDVVIVGAGAGGLAAAASIQKRDAKLKIAVIDPADTHYYQPGWTLVGAGIFKPEKTKRPMATLIPKGVDWIQSAVAQFEPEKNQVLLEGCRPIKYQQLVVAAGLKLNWEGIEGLNETLGKNGVTSNYRYDLAPYTWELVKNLKKGKAVFTQPPMPIKCAGAPQKVMYLSADTWLKNGQLKDIDVEFYNTGPGLFGVKDYVPALQEYIKKYAIELKFQHQLMKVDGPNKKAWFKQVGEGASDQLLEVTFDMLHVCPPQVAPDFIRVSPLADDNGWVDVDQHTLRHKRFENVWSLGDVMNAPNAKTAAAVRMQAPVLAYNLIRTLNNKPGQSAYNGYGSCPLTVERGKIVLAEFGYGGKLLPSFPGWLINGLKPTRAAWILKERFLPEIYWSVMLKGHEWMAKPTISDKQQ